jgi:Flp pilus assembly protein TadG
MKHTSVKLLSLKKRVVRADGQSLMEMAFALPIVLMMVLGVSEVGYALLHEHVITKMSREGANLISRNTALADAAAAIRSMATPPVDFNSNTKMIFSVIKQGTVSGTTNYNQSILYQRYEFGSFSASSSLQTRGAGSFNSDYTANNSDSDSSLQITNLPPNLVTTGGMVYVAEIYTRHTLITPVDRIPRFGFVVPQTLYSIAYF